MRKPPSLIFADPHSGSLIKAAAKAPAGRSAGDDEFLVRIDRLVDRSPNPTDLANRINVEVARALASDGAAKSVRLRFARISADEGLGVGPGPVTTIAPTFVRDVEIATSPVGWCVAKRGAAIPSAASRLAEHSRTTIWTVVLPLARDRACLETLTRFTVLIDHCARTGAKDGRPLDLEKLDIRITNERVDRTYDFVPIKDTIGAIENKVLVDLRPRNGLRMSMSMSLNSADGLKAIQFRDRAMSMACPVKLGALRDFLGVCRPDGEGHVASSAIEMWLSTPMPSLSSLQNWRPDVQGGPG